MLSFADYKDKISKSVHYHIENNIPFAENIYRLHSEEFYRLFREARELYNEGLLTEISDWDKQLLETDIGEFAYCEEEKRKVPLDVPISMEEKDVELNKPKSGGSKKWYVYVRNPKTGKVKKVSYGSPVMTAKWNDPEARKSFAARHQCDKKKDKTKAGYWACRAHKDFGKNVPGRFW